MKRILIPLWGDDVAPRFDLAPEVVIAVLDEDGRLLEERTIVMPETSAEALCHLILRERIQMVVCCGIEDEYHQYLTWKEVQVVDSVMGPYERVLQKVREGSLREGENLLAGENQIRAGS